MEISFETNLDKDYLLNPFRLNITGLLPANPNNGRPKPVFSLIGFGDIQLELLSWLGLYLCLLFVRYESMILAAGLWASYLSIGVAFVQLHQKEHFI